MAALTSIASSGLNALANQQAARAQARRAGAEAAAREQEAGLAVARIRDADAATERRRREALRRTLAAARARLAAQGVGAAGGSGAAVLSGLAHESELAARDAAAESAGRIAAIRHGQAARTQIDLLEREADRRRAAIRTLQSGIGLVSPRRDWSASLLDF